MRKNYFLFILAILLTMNIMAQNIPSYVPKDGLVGYWPFNGNANDESGNGNHGTVNGATLTADKNGVANSAYSFDGVKSFIEVPFKNIFNAYPLSITTWIKTKSEQRGAIISKYENCSSNGYAITSNSGKLSTYYYSQNKAEINTDCCLKEKINDDIWKMITVVFNKDSVFIYSDNKLIDQHSFSMNTPNATSSMTNLIFGKMLKGMCNLGYDLFFDGLIDDIAIYNRALSEQEINALYTSTPVAQNIPSYVPKEGLVGYWPFNGNANDESGNGNHGTVNGATLTADRNGVANSAYIFDGVSNFIEINYNSIYNCYPLSINLWVKTETEKSNNGAIISRYENCSNNGYTIFYDENSYHAYYYSKNGAFINTAGDNTVQSKKYTWEMLSIVFSNNKMEFYNDGILKKTELFNLSASEPSTTTQLFFGKILKGQCNMSNDTYLTGQLDDISIYNRALSEQEIAQLYAGCTKETATSSNFNTLIYTNDVLVNLTATPTGGSFSGNGVANNAFNPSKAKLGKNQIKYNFKNSTGCADSTDFTMLVVDTVGATCTKYDTITVKNNVYDTVTIKNNVFDTVKVTKYDTITVTNNVTKYDTVTVTKFDTVTVKNNIYDTVTIKNNVFDTVKVTKYDTLTVTNNVTKYDTITITNNVTKYDTVIINKTKYDTVIVKTNVFYTVKVTKYDTLTVTNNVTKYDTVSILKIKFKLTTGIHANQLSSLSIYPNPTSDVLHIDVPDAKALEGYRYRILDALSKEVYNQLVTQSTTEIPLKTLGAAGIYQFEILDATKTSIQSNKIVLQ